MIIRPSPLVKDSLLIIILGALFLTLATPRIKFPDLDHGDEWADADILTAAENFAKFGFIKTRFLPFFEPQFATPEDAYTHYPPMGHILHGLFMKLFKTQSLYFFRGIALFVSLLNILFWYLFIRRLTGSYLLGFLCAVFYLTNPLFIYGMDSLNQPAYSEFLRTMIMFTCLSMLASRGARKAALLACVWVLYFFLSLWTYEYVIYIFLFFILFKYFFREAGYAFSWRHIFILATAPVLAFLLHFLQNSWYFASFARAFQDLRNSAAMRILHSPDAPSGHLNFPAWFKLTILRNFSLVLLFDYLTLALAALFSFFLFCNLSSESKKKIKVLFRLFIILGICGISWYVFFPSHSIAHAFVNFLARHLVLVACVGFALVCYIVLAFIKQNNPKNIFGALALLCIVVAILFKGVTRSELPVTAGAINGARSFVVFKDCLLKLRQTSSEKDEIGVNYYRNTFMRYYTHRRCVYVPDKAYLENMRTTPRFFIFFPFPDARSVELFALIKEKYAPIFQCPSDRFPGIFCELKK